MIRGLAVLLVCQLIGEVAVRAAGLPLPGPVLGLVLLFALLALVRARAAGGTSAFAAAADDTGVTADRILGALGLLFVPAGVGVVTKLDLFARHGVALSAALAVSVVATLVVTVLVFLAVKRLLPPRPADGEAGDG